MTDSPPDLRPNTMLAAVAMAAGMDDPNVAQSRVLSTPDTERMLAAVAAAAFGIAPSSAALATPAPRPARIAAAPHSPAAVLSPSGGPVAAEMAVASYRSAPLAPRYAAVPAASAPPVALTPAEQVIAEWKASPAIRQEFRGNFSSWAAWAMRDHAKATGQSVQQIEAVRPDVTGYIAGLESRGERLSTADRTAIEGFASTWRASADIRAEFREFSTFCAYQRARAAGRAKIYGGG